MNLSTAMVWLLVSLGGNGQTITVAHFKEQQECQRVSSVLQERFGISASRLLCVQATVVKP